MSPAEPLTTAILLTTFGVLLAISILFSRASERVGVPVALIFLGLGMAAGSEGLGGIEFDNVPFAFRLGMTALVLILFDGGLNTPISAVRLVIAPSALLATLGVVGTAGLVAAGGRMLGWGWSESLLLGAIVSSTDAAAVFAVLRGSGIHLKRRVGGTLEVESGLNDPMAILLTTVLLQNLLDPGSIVWWQMLIQVILEAIVGASFGIVIGYSGRIVLARFRLLAGGLYPAFTLALAFLAFGAPTLLHGSGFLSVYIAAVILGNGQLPYRASLLRVHDAMAWLSQIAMFLVLGLLVFPSRLVPMIIPGIGLGLFLAAVARPLVVGVLLAPFNYTLRDILYVGWVGLRGAVPIILAMFPVLAGAPGAERIFSIVFVIVVVNALVPGGTVPWVTRALKLESSDPPAPKAVLEIESSRPLRGELLSFYIEEPLVVAGAALADLPFPEGAAVALIVRGEDIVPARGNTTLQPGDHVYVFARPEDRSFMTLMFGRPEGE